MKIRLLLLLLSTGVCLRAQIPVTDVANLTNNSILHAETIAKWIDSIAQLRTQISQLNQQIDLQTDLRAWTGNPVSAAAKVVLNGLGEEDLVRTYGQSKDALLQTLNEFDTLRHTADGNYRAIDSVDIDGQPLARDPLLFRRYAVVDVLQANAETVSVKTREREHALQSEVAVTLDELRGATTDAEVQKQTAKLAVLNGQLDQVDAARRREVDAVTLQKISNDQRAEEERVAAAELAATDDYLAQRRISTYLGSLKVRRDYAP